jgi:hypothetical protein
MSLLHFYVGYLGHISKTLWFVCQRDKKVHYSLLKFLFITVIVTTTLMDHFLLLWSPPTTLMDHIWGTPLIDAAKVDTYIYGYTFLLKEQDSLHLSRRDSLTSLEPFI